jgi:hypothetical protein
MSNPAARISNNPFLFLVIKFLPDKMREEKGVKKGIMIV